MPFQSHSILGNGKDRYNTRHERKEFLPLMFLLLPFFRYDFSGTDINECSCHCGKHYGVNYRCCKFIHSHSDCDTYRSTCTEYREEFDDVFFWHSGFEECYKERNGLCRLLCVVKYGIQSNKMK